jgi:hypothetical protein
MVAQRANDMDKHDRGWFFCFDAIAPDISLVI